jgi:hypothetical protein
VDCFELAPYREPCTFKEFLKSRDDVVNRLEGLGGLNGYSDVTALLQCPQMISDKYMAPLFL